MNDPTESIRREMVAQINAEPGSRAALEAKHGQVWGVRRKSDGIRGSLMFQHHPRFYFSFQPE